MENWEFIIIASLLSGLISIIVSIVYYRKHERYQMKLKTLLSFTKYRYDIMGSGFTEALNEIFVTFSGSKEVIESLEKFHNDRMGGQFNNRLSNKLLANLFKDMCDELNIDSKKLGDLFFLNPFNLKK